MSLKKKMISFFVGLMAFIVTNPLVAQDFSDDQLQSFVTALTQIQTIQQEAGTKVTLAIDEGNIDSDTYYEIQAQLYQGSQPAEVDEADLRAFKAIEEEIQVIQSAAQESMVETLEDNGLTVEVYNSIISSAQNDPELMESIQELLGA